MNTPILLPAALLGLLSLGCQNLQPAGPGNAAAAAEQDDGQERTIALGEVPRSVQEAALAAVPGIAFTSAETEIEDGIRVYCLSGSAGGKAYEVEVAADGRVLEIESEDGEDEDEDGEDGA